MGPLCDASESQLEMFLARQAKLITHKKAAMKTLSCFLCFSQPCPRRTILFSTRHRVRASVSLLASGKISRHAQLQSSELTSGKSHSRCSWVAVFAVDASSQPSEVEPKKRQLEGDNVGTVWAEDPSDSGVQSFRGAQETVLGGQLEGCARTLLDLGIRVSGERRLRRGVESVEDVSGHVRTRAGSVLRGLWVVGAEGGGCGMWVRER